MQFSAALAVAALAGAAQAYYPTNSSSSVVVDYVTEVVSSYETYCPYATTLTYNSKTYTVTEPTTLTLTGYPYTVVKPVTYSTYVPATTAPVYPVYNATKPVVTYTPVGTTSKYATSTPKPTNLTTSGAGSLVAMSGASLAGLLAFAAYVL